MNAPRPPDCSRPTPGPGARAGRPVLALIVLFAAAIAGCHAPVPPASPTPTAAPTPRTVACDAFGTGGVFLVTETNANVPSRAAARRILRAAREKGSLETARTTTFSFVPAERAGPKATVRDEIRRLPANATLYYFAPDGDADVHEMAIVSETGRVYRAFVGAC